MVLSKGFLENRTPEGTIPALTSRLSDEFAISVVRERKEIIDDDRVGDTKGVEVYAINAVGVDVTVKEDRLHSVALFSEC